MYREARRKKDIRETEELFDRCLADRDGEKPRMTIGYP